MRSKLQDWRVIQWLIQEGDFFARGRAANALGDVFSQISDKAQAWRDLHRLIRDEDSYVRGEAAYALGKAFSQIPDKAQAWQDLIRLIQDEDSYVRWRASEALGEAFSQVLDKAQAWRDLHKLTQDEDNYVRRGAAYTLGEVFSEIPDKAQAWQDLHRLTQDEDNYARSRAAYALGKAFSQIPDKAQAWQDLHRLTQDEDNDVRWRAAYALGKAFSEIPDKAQAWQDLHRLTQNEDNDVRWRAAYALGEVFSQIPNKARVRQDLDRLAQDKDIDVRMYAYYSLGRMSITKATEAKDSIVLKKELDDAVSYFEKSSKEEPISGPARFCYPFYRTYFAITFQEAKEDVIQAYLDEVKEVVDGSESRDELIKAVENLAEALQESQHLKERSFREVASEFNNYSSYCLKAAEHMVKAEDKAPGAVKLLRKCNPLIEDRIQKSISEIQEAARQICQATRGSRVESVGADINKTAQALLINDFEDLQKSFSRMLLQIKKLCENLPEEEKNLALEVLEEAESEDKFPQKVHKIELAFNLASSAIKTSLQIEEIYKDFKREIHAGTDTILTHLDEAQEVTTKTFLGALEEKGDQDLQFQELLSGTLNTLMELVTEIEKKAALDSDPTFKKDVEKAVDIIKDPGINIKHKMEITIPLIPILCNYKYEAEIEGGINLKAAWDKLTGSLHKHTDE